MKTTLWQNYDLTELYEDEKAYREEEGENLTENELWEIVYDINSMDLEDLRDAFKNTYEDIIILATLGLWDGKRCGVRWLPNTSLKELFYSDCDYVEWYCDRYNLKCDAYHHDGTNHYLYRAWKDGISEEQKHNFCNKAICGRLNKNDISKYTKSLLPTIKEGIM